MFYSTLGDRFTLNWLFIPVFYGFSPAANKFFPARVMILINDQKRSFKSPDTPGTELKSKLSNVWQLDE